ncbi:MAG: tripartite tricarboxylate transporter substrate binding protein [Burkholderiales bacterium]|nr:tripartite tricarboxylate transporter substrate binding protein [Burkholderiales bacterium]
MQLLRRHLIALATLLSASLAGAQGYPDKPINVIIPFPPGIVDGYARVVAEKAGAILGQPMVFRNQAGAGQRIGTDALTKSAKDGYTIGVVTNAGVVAGPALASNVPYDPTRDLSYLTLVLESHYLINTHPKSGHKSLRELISAAKAAPDKIKFGSTGLGTGFHLATEQFMYTAGIKALHVPYRGESPLLTDLIGGQVEFGFSSLASQQMVESGRLVALAYTGERRLASLPNVPTVKELGIAHVSAGWLGFALPAGVPAAVRNRLIAAFTTAVTDPAVVASYSKGGVEPRSISGDAFAARVARELDELRELNKTLKITLE